MSAADGPKIVVGGGSHRLVGSTYGWRVERPSSASEKAIATLGEDAYWQGRDTYHSNLESAFDLVLREKVRAAEATTLEELKEAIAAARSEVRSDLERLGV